ncbi:MAG: putative sulfate exporter family transporter [Alistipes sp.]|nr:putative sulfate exporter family transporter [Alistipes sp.]
MKKLLTEDWVVTFLSIPLLVFAALASLLPNGGISVSADLTELTAWVDIALFFVIALALLFLGNKILNRPLKGLLPSFVVVFAIALLAQWIAKIDAVKYYGFEAVFFSVIFGLIIRNAFHIPEWLKPAIQGEFFIKIGVVCLGATVLFSDVMKSGAAGLIQAILVVGIVWFFGYWLARKLKVDEATAMTLASGCSICGVSACITAAGVAGTEKKQLSYLISVVLIIVVPMIYLMPWLAKLIVPMVVDDPMVQNEVIGAWIGGTIDTTSGVGASSEMAGELAQKTAIVVKATQNVLIGVVAFFIALYLSARSGDGGSFSRPSFGIVWEKFPKFILGFVLASAVFSILQSQDMLTLNEKGKIIETATAKNFSTFFFSLSFVCIGMDTRLKEIVSRENRHALWAFIGAQLFNICVTFLIAWLMFGVVKPALWPSKIEVESPKAVDVEEAITVDNQFTIPVAPAATESDVNVVEFERLTVEEVEEIDEVEEIEEPVE